MIDLDVVMDHFGVLVHHHYGDFDGIAALAVVLMDERETALIGTDLMANAASRTSLVNRPRLTAIRLAQSDLC